LSVGDEIKRDPMLMDLDSWVTLATRQHGLMDGLTRCIGSMRDPPDRMSTFSREVKPERALGIRGERHSDLHQPLDSRFAFLGNPTRNLRVDQARTGLQRIVHMLVNAIGDIQDTDDTPLGPGRGRVRSRALGQDHHIAIVGKLERDRKPRKTCPNHNDR
jgi:hypothetical protein